MNLNFRRDCAKCDETKTTQIQFKTENGRLFSIVNISKSLEALMYVFSGATRLILRTDVDSQFSDMFIKNLTLAKINAIQY